MSIKQLVCKNCAIEFERNVHRIYCSISCRSQDAPWRDKICLGRQNKKRTPHSEITKEKIRKSNKLRWATDDTLITHHRAINLGAKNPFYGRHHDEKSTC